MKLTVDGKEISVEPGGNLLEACLGNGITIPNLCFMKEMENPPASCRLCFVQIEGQSKPSPSCRVAPVEGMVVKTDTEEIRRLQRSALRLLLSVHKVDCRNCHANKKCELQRIAKFLRVGLKPGPLEKLPREVPRVPVAHPLFAYDQEKCVLCGRCVFVCRKLNGSPFLSFAERSFDTVITWFGETDAAAPLCRECMRCVAACPVGALVPKV